MSYINPMLNSLGGVQMALAAAYESRIHTFSKMNVPRAQFAGDTAVTLTDGSYNSRHTIITAGTPAMPGSDIPTSATAQLASTSNSRMAATDGGGRPMVIRTLRDPFTAEIYDYAVFNADGTFPGCAADGTGGQNPLVWISARNRFEIVNSLDPEHVTAFGGLAAAEAAEPRYKVNKLTGEIYLNRRRNILEHQNPDGLVDMDLNGMRTLLDGADDLADAIGGFLDNVVGIVDFEGLQGGALSSAQQEASELSGIIQSLTSVIRTVNDSKKNVLSLIR